MDENELKNAMLHWFT